MYRYTNCLVLVNKIKQLPITISTGASIYAEAINNEPAVTTLLLSF